jgi:hypothetical protein
VTPVAKQWRFPDELAMKALADGSAFEGALFMMTLPTTKNPLNLPPVGPSDTNGESRISRGPLEVQFQQAGRDGIQDYGASLGELWVRVVNRPDIARLRRGYDLWHAHLPFPDDYSDRLDAAQEALRPRAGQTLRAVCAGTGGDFEIRCSIQQA